MATLEFRMPDVGEGLADVEVTKWLVKVGDRVEENDPVADVETDKAVVIMPAPASGRIRELSVDEGQRVKVGAVLLVMDVEGQAEPSRAARGGARGGPTEAESRRREPAPRARVLAAPAVRKFAAEHGIALEAVEGAGPEGRITLEDVKKLAEGSAEAKAEPPPSAEVEAERVPLRGVRRRIAEAMTHSAQTIPHVCGFHELDVEALVRLRSRLRPRAEEAGVRLTFLPFIVRAVVLALKEHPYLNSSIDHEELVILLKKSFNIGIATSTEQGLVVPVLHDTDRLGMLDIARQIDRLTSVAREGRLAPSDMKNGTFTITNVGQAGGWFGTSIIRHPEAAILGLGRITERPVVRGEQIVIRSMLPVSLTFDHRIIDGDVALAFVQTLRELLEKPEQLLLGQPEW